MFDSQHCWVLGGACKPSLGKLVQMEPGCVQMVTLVPMCGYAYLQAPFQSGGPSKCGCFFSISNGTVGRCRSRPPTISVHPRSAPPMVVGLFACRLRSASFVVLFVRIYGPACRIRFRPPPPVSAALAPPLSLPATPASLGRLSSSAAAWPEASGGLSAKAGGLSVKGGGLSAASVPARPALGLGGCLAGGGRQVPAGAGPSRGVGDACAVPPRGHATDEPPLCRRACGRSTKTVSTKTVSTRGLRAADSFH